MPGVDTASRSVDWSVLGDWFQRELRDAGDRLVAFSFGLVQALLVAFLAYLIVKWARKRVRRPRLIARLGLNLVSLAANILAIGIYIVAFALILAVFGVSLSALITYLSVTTLAVGLALQETLRNTIAGIYLLLERPFNIGDRIMVRDIRGTLENVELRTTAIRSDAGNLVLIPNAIVYSEIVTNRTATQATRMQIDVAKLPLDPVAARDGVLDLVKRLDDLRLPDPIVEVTASGDAGTTVRVAVWHDPEVMIRTGLIAAIAAAYPGSEVSSASDA